MKSFFAAAAILAASNSFAVADPVAAPAPAQTTGIEQPASAPQLNAAVVVGCYSSKGPLKFEKTIMYNSMSSCALETCQQQGHKVAGTMGGNQCFCGDEYPPQDTLADDSKCNVGCTGFDKQACGGIDFWTVYNTGLQLAVPYAPNISSSASSSTSAPTSTSSSANLASSTSASAATSTSASGGGSQKSGPNVAGIAAGVVVAVVVVAAAMGGMFFYMRRRRNQEIEDDHRRNAAVTAFIHGHKGAGSTGGSSMADARLDPVMAQRRMSDGSIADNEDYSRRILRVTNA